MSRISMELYSFKLDCSVSTSAQEQLFIEYSYTATDCKGSSEFVGDFLEMSGD
jgi:hypothetical protein